MRCGEVVGAVLGLLCAVTPPCGCGLLCGRSCLRIGNFVLVGAVSIVATGLLLAPEARAAEPPSIPPAPVSPFPPPANRTSGPVPEVWAAEPPQEVRISYPPPVDTVSAEHPCVVRFLPIRALEASSARTRAIRAGAGDVGFRTRIRGEDLCGSFLEVLAGGAEARGRLAVTAGNPPASSSAPLPDRGGGALRLRGEVDLHPRVRVGGDLGVMGSWVRVEALYGEILLGPLYSWVGSRAPAYGPGRGGGIVLSGGASLNGIGAGMTAPVSLPWHLRRVGSVDFEAVLARGADNGKVGKPLVLAGRGTLAFRENLVLGVNRGVMFGGEGMPGLNLRRVYWMLVGDHQYENDEWVDIDNQIASFDLAWRPRPGGVPLLFYLDWGMEDSAGAWIHSPGIVGGIEVVHPHRGLRVGLEHTHFSPEVMPDHGLHFRHSIWYRHGRFEAGWSNGGRLLGHPLGGPGSEWLLHGAVHAADGAWDLQAGLRVRHRHSLQNSFAAYREGRATGGFLEGRARMGPVDLYLQLDGEHLTGGQVVGTGEGGIRWRLGWGDGKASSEDP